LDSVASKNEFSISFKPNNPFMKIDSADLLVLNTNGNTHIEIQNRDVQGKIPKISLTGDATFEDDGKIIYSKDNSVYLEEGANKKATSTPFELFTENNDKKFIVSNFREFAIGVPLEIEEYAIGSYEGTILPKMVSTSLTYNYPSEQELKDKWGISLNLKLGDGFSKPEVLRQIRDIYASLPEDLRNKAKFVQILNKEDYEKIHQSFQSEMLRTEDSNTLGFFVPGGDEGGTIYLESGNSFPTMGTIRHELTHVLVDSFYPKEVQDEIKNLSNNLKNTLDKNIILIKNIATLNNERSKLRVPYDISSGLSSEQIQEKHDKLVLELQKPYDIKINDLESQKIDISKDMQRLVKLQESPDFIREWIDVAGGSNVYGDIRSRIKIVSGRFSWADDTRVVPLFNEYDNLMNRYKQINADYIKNPTPEGYKMLQLLIGPLEAWEKKFEEENNKLDFERPRDGFVSPYASSDYNEDIAMTALKINDPSFFKTLINPDSPQYNPKYKLKLDVLLKYHAITQFEYDAIMKEAVLK
jgi:hypothetical protein